MTTAYVTHPRYVEHRMEDYPHPEHPGRIQTVWDRLAEANLIDRLLAIQPQPIDPERIAAIHSQQHLELLQRIARQSSPVLIDADTYARPESYDIARLAAGGVVEAVDAVLRGQAQNGLAAVRPPGHHATPLRPMGFCLLGNIAIAARYAQTQHQVKHILIVDYDVHHGNGTQDIFYNDNTVLFISTHQHPYYPGTGALQETGEGQGTGFTINIPLPAGHGNGSYAAIFEQVVWAAARRFQPELILVSAGFDAHWKDPLARMQLSLSGYDHLTRELIRMADELCDGRIVFVMEGGYDLGVIGHGMRNIAHALLGDVEISDPFGSSEGTEIDAQPLIDQIKAIHGL